MGAFSLGPKISRKGNRNVGGVSELVDKILCVGWKQGGARQKVQLVTENPTWATVVLDLDGTLLHTLVEPAQVAAAQRRGLTGCRLPGKMGISVLRPGLEQLFASLSGYNVVIFSAGGSTYVNTVMKMLVAEYPFMQGRICKILCREELTKYSESSESPKSTSLNTEGVKYVKDLRKCRRDGNTDKVIIIEDNPEAYQVDPQMQDEDFKSRYNFAINALLVPEFCATDPDAPEDRVFVEVSQVLLESRHEGCYSTRMHASHLQPATESV